jgi:hypothetical protein
VRKPSKYRIEGTASRHMGVSPDSPDQQRRDQRTAFGIVADLYSQWVIGVSIAILVAGPMAYFWCPTRATASRTGDVFLVILLAATCIGPLFTLWGAVTLGWWKTKHGALFVWSGFMEGVWISVILGTCMGLYEAFWGDRLFPDANDVPSLFTRGDTVTYCITLTGVIVGPMLGVGRAIGNSIVVWRARREGLTIEQIEQMLPPVR